MTENPLHLLMKPRSIAIAGANNNPLKMGTMHALSILKDGFQGTLYPIHPREESVMGLKAYSSPLELPEAPDLAFLVVPSDQVLTLMEDFGRRGTRRAVIISAGFKETGAEGRALEDRLREITSQYGIRFVGPNCMGIINSEISLNTTVVTFQQEPGFLGFASQSGTYITQSLPYLVKRGIRFSKAISVGNEANISIIDALEFLAEDEQTRAIALYIEGIRDVPRFLEVARKITPHKPVLAQYVGGSAAGARSGLSHTGALAAPDFLYEGLFRQAGILRVSSVEDLYGHGWALATQPPLRGRRIGVITNSGGPGTAMSDILDNAGMEVPPFSESLREEIKAMIPPHAPSGNPVDITFSMNIEILTRRLPELIMKSGEVDGIVLHGIMFSGYIRVIYPHIKELIGNMPLDELIKNMQKDISGDIRLPWEHSIPMVLSSFLDRDDDYIAGYEDGGVPSFDSPEKTARAMVALNRFREIRERRAYEPALLPQVSAEAGALIRKVLDSGRHTLDEFEAKNLLACYNIPICREELATSEEEAVKFAHLIGYPVVFKGCSPDILHKTGKGLIQLNLKNENEAREAYRALQKSAGGSIPVLVAEMVRGEREFLAGMTRHPGFGPALVFGLGGVFTEALKDTVFRVPPLSREDAREMTGDIRASALLGAFRGMPPANREQLAHLLEQLSFLPLLHPEIAEIDLNPILLRGSDPVVVDALIALRAD